jgi:dTDP-4-amino-4,6-dideoxygalactose transaminase
MNPHQVTKDFEKAIGEYTGAPYVVCVNSCTMALLLAVAWHTRNDIDGIDIEIPKRTYVGVPMSIIHAGGRPTFRDEEWLGWYQLKPIPVVDSARFFSAGMYSEISHELVMKRDQIIPPPFICVSFHASKILGIEQGGAILLDDPEADMWLRRARFDGRVEGVAPKDQKEWMVGWHCYMNPSTAAQGLLKLHSLPRHNAPLPNDPYPELDKLDIFK